MTGFNCLPAWQRHSEQQRLVHSQPAKLQFLRGRKLKSVYLTAICFKRTHKFGFSNEVQTLGMPRGHMHTVWVSACSVCIHLWNWNKCTSTDINTLCCLFVSWTWRMTLHWSCVIAFCPWDLISVVWLSDLKEKQEDFLLTYLSALCPPFFLHLLPIHWAHSPLSSLDSSTELLM